MRLSPKKPSVERLRLSFGARQGMTLLELTVVILVLLSLISVLFIGAQAWKRGSDRTLCIMNMHNVQKGVRSYSNLHAHIPGQSVIGLQSRIFGLGKFIEETPDCPASGTYTMGPTFGADTIPPVGEIYMQCSLSSAGHIPDDYADW